MAEQKISCAVDAVPGLHYLPDYIGPGEHDRVLEHVDAGPWMDELKRRVQHHGWRYDYRRRHVDPTMHLGPLPGWAKPLARRLHAEGWFDAEPDQLIVNEYQPGQGIAPHVDCEPCFGPTVASLSLGSAVIMELTEPGGGRKVPLHLAPGSLLVLSGEARWRWKHGIPARRSDPAPDGGRLPRSRRVSLTFRTVVLPGELRVELGGVSLP